ncbi:hypothetical protein GCM10011510_17840 [Streptococcus himalayensis]|uniref:Uncharacterized protein n=1 Tax=Streptococcus himalayensis TaxID=1888195 RepID=A0A917EHV0_9STRE|nr:hypothetical protein GCM10011510_17840 [Streptococcus himalayensis]
MKIFIIDGSNWRGMAHYSPSLDVVYISDRVPKSEHVQLIEAVKQKGTIWR